MTPRLKLIFNKEIQPALKNQFGFKNIYMTPKIEIGYQNQKTDQVW